MKKTYYLSIILALFSYGLHAQSVFGISIADSAFTLTHEEVRYDPGYYSIDYPNGDVPGDIGVCTDVIIRGLRKVGIDLQKEVHEDMKANFGLYPKKWGLTKPDPNIDHRRVLNLMTYFDRFVEVISITSDPDNYLPGDIVCWDLGGGITHIGFVSNRKSSDSNSHMIIHNIGNGQVLEDCLFNYHIIGHYRINK